MANWPSISPPDYGLSEDFYKPQVRTEFEGNYVQSRPRSTRAVHRWSLKWSALLESEFQTLKTFFDTNQGTSFTWTHPLTSVSYSCRFSTDTLTSRIVVNDYREVECSIEEV